MEAKKPVIKRNPINMLYWIGDDGTVWKNSVGGKRIQIIGSKLLQCPRRRFFLKHPHRYTYAMNLVAETFLGEPPSEDHFPRHKNGNCLDDRLVNIHYAEEPGKCICNSHKKGKPNPQFRVPPSIAKVAWDMFTNLGIAPKIICKQLELTAAQLRRVLKETPTPRGPRVPCIDCMGKKKSLLPPHGTCTWCKGLGTVCVSLARQRFSKTEAVFGPKPDYKCLRCHGTGFQSHRQRDGAYVTCRHCIGLGHKPFTPEEIKHIAEFTP